MVCGPFITGVSNTADLIGTLRFALLIRQGSLVGLESSIRRCIYLLTGGCVSSRAHLFLSVFWFRPTINSGRSSVCHVALHANRRSVPFRKRGVLLSSFSIESMIFLAASLSSAGIASGSLNAMAHCSLVPEYRPSEGFLGKHMLSSPNRSCGTYKNRQNPTASMVAKRWP
jgi:hypothetical protein